MYKARPLSRAALTIHKLLSTKGNDTTIQFGLINIVVIIIIMYHIFFALILYLPCFMRHNRGITVRSTYHVSCFCFFIWLLCKCNLLQLPSSFQIPPETKQVVCDHKQQHDKESKHTTASNENTELISYV